MQRFNCTDQSLIRDEVSNPDLNIKDLARLCQTVYPGGWVSKLSYDNKIPDTQNGEIEFLYDNKFRHDLGPTQQTQRVVIRYRTIWTPHVGV
jgi:hypothetical protein